jgi:osmotically-inducible protein OsmY
MKILNAPAGFAAVNLADICQRKLRESPYYFLKNLSCQCDDGVLTLRGQVPLAPLKQLAESIVARIAGVHDVVNRIEVVDPARVNASARAARNAG